MPDSEALLTAHAASQACLSCEDLRRQLASAREASVQAMMTLQGERDSLAERLREARELLRMAHKEFCSNVCPSVKKDGEPWVHNKVCLQMQTALAAPPAAPASQKGAGE